MWQADGGSLNSTKYKSPCTSFPLSSTGHLSTFLKSIFFLFLLVITLYYVIQVYRCLDFPHSSHNPLDLFLLPYFMIPTYHIFFLISCSFPPCYLLDCFSLFFPPSSVLKEVYFPSRSYSGFEFAKLHLLSEVEPSLPALSSAALASIRFPGCPMDSLSFFCFIWNQHGVKMGKKRKFRVENQNIIPTLSQMRVTQEIFSLWPDGFANA